ncbi:putative ATPase [Deinobacterium chartae]|uniref:Putative ATPase n=1 Tax=Deinobacterium chartae TaxID=521158 RepID=A0A841I0H2_9DEIO|nr:AAA family ATPase [Deinobacterium chartae]MBB6097758.1 putative ATPase [Deinobacterium chartae]
MVPLLALRLEDGPHDRYPFAIPALRGLTRLELDCPVTFLVGENGSGKSTLLSGLACAAGAITAGRLSAADDPDLPGGRLLSERLRLEWRHRTSRGFFLRAEDFFGYVLGLKRLREDLEADLERSLRESTDLPDGERQRRAAPYRGQLGALRNYGAPLEARSHGEGYLAFFAARFVPGGLHLLDEPEAALSPMRQLALLSLLRACAEQGGQFVIATHSPLLLAYPQARIYEFSESGVNTAVYEELEAVRLTRHFLEDPGRFLRHL